jgi:hypothetical protein
MPKPHRHNWKPVEERIDVGVGTAYYYCANGCGAYKGNSPEGGRWGVIKDPRSIERIRAEGERGLERRGRRDAMSEPHKQIHFAIADLQRALAGYVERDRAVEGARESLGKALKAPRAPSAAVARVVARAAKLLAGDDPAIANAVEDLKVAVGELHAHEPCGMEDEL